MTVAALHAALSSPGASTALTHATVTTVPTGSGGTVKIALASPADLAAAAGLSREAYALARVIRSEGYGSSKDPERTARGRAAAAVAIGQAIRNGAELKKKSIEGALTASNFVAAAGYFGEQSGRYAATTLDPTMWTGQVAQAVLANDVPELAQGAHKFLDMAVFAGGEQAGRPLGALKSVLTSWMMSEGLEWIGPIPTVDPYYLILLRRGSSSSAERQSQLDELLAIYEAGKGGDHEPADGDPDGGSLGGVGALVALLLLLGAAYLASGGGKWL
jgi:hypothetical protein